jgi:hypothetical protein
MPELELKPGTQTSEFQLSKNAMLVADLISAAGIILEALAQAGYGARWVGMAVLAIGVIKKIHATSLYVNRRVELKAVAMEETSKMASEAAAQVRDLDDTVRMLNEASKRLEQK